MRGPWGASTGAFPVEHISLPSELIVVTINSHQNTPGTGRMRQLAKALRSRPIAGDGVFYAPDVIVFNEMPPGVLASLRNRLNSLFAAPAHFEMAGSTVDSVKGKFLVNTGGVAIIGSETWSDVCEPSIRYQLINL